MDNQLLELVAESGGVPPTLSQKGPPPPPVPPTDPTSFLQLVILAYWCCYYFNIPGIPGSTGRCEGSAAEQLTSPLTKMHID